MTDIQEKVAIARQERLSDDGGLATADPEQVSIAQFNSGAMALRLTDPIKYAAMQRSILMDFFKSQMIENQDYGKIAGCGPKPALFKAGAEKIASLFNYSIEIASTRDTEDFEGGFLSYNYMATVKDFSGRTIAQCEGNCNSKEKKYIKQDPFTIMNTLMKMAQKRAIVGAVRVATNSSAFFANAELEMRQDITPSEQRTQWDTVDAEVVEETYATQPQQKRLWAIATQAGHTEPSIRALLETHGVDSFKKIPAKQYEAICTQAGNEVMAQFFLAQTEEPIPALD